MDAIQNARQLRNELLSDPYRPTYHIVSPEGVSAPFDPNATIYWRGRYHLFYIVQTEEGHCWGHVSSQDLVHWRHHPLGLRPGGVDTGIYSGGIALDKDGIPTITYWGLGEEAGICLASATDDNLDHWVKHPSNPVIHQQAHGLTYTEEGEPIGAADPSAFWIHDSRYYMMTGNLLVLREYGLARDEEDHQGDTTYLFVSDDLVHWEYLHRFYRSSRTWTQINEDNMCPDFFSLGDRHMLLFISHNLGCQYYLGRYENHYFYPETHGRMTHIDNGYFAPESLLDAQGRRIMWAWVKDGRSKESQIASQWSGAMSLPRLLWLGEDKTLRMGVPDELKVLRGAAQQIGNMDIPNGVGAHWQSMQENCYELEVEMDGGSSTRFGVVVCSSPNGEEETRIYYDCAERELCIDTTRSSLGEGAKSIESGPLALAQGEPLALRIFVDRSMIEVYANDRQALSRCVYPTSADSRAVAFFSDGGDARVVAATAWLLAPANAW